MIRTQPISLLKIFLLYVVFVFTGRYEDTLLHAVAERGHSSIFKLILNEVVNKNPKGHFADTPLHFAAEKGHTGKIVYFICTLKVEIILGQR